MRYASLGSTKASKDSYLKLLLRYGGAVMTVAATFVIRDALSLAVGPGLPPFILFYPAVMIVALLAGMGPGLAGNRSRFFHCCLLGASLAGSWCDCQSCRRPGPGSFCGHGCVHEYCFRSLAPGAAAGRAVPRRVVIARKR